MGVSEADAVYELVTRGFIELGASDPERSTRSFLLHDLCYAGQVWRCEGWTAIWRLGIESVEFYDAAGNPVMTLSLVPEAAKRAA